MCPTWLTKPVYSVLILCFLWFCDFLDSALLKLFADRLNIVCFVTTILLHVLGSVCLFSLKRFVFTAIASSCHLIPDTEPQQIGNIPIWWSTDVFCLFFWVSTVGFPNTEDWYHKLHKVSHFLDNCNLNDIGKVIFYIFEDLSNYIF